MNLIEATRLVMAESAARPDLMRVTRHAYDELSAGREVPHTTLRWMLREAGLSGVFNALDQRHGAEVVKDMILVLEHEIDRHAPLGTH